MLDDEVYRPEGPYNDPPANSIFEKIDDTTNRCTVCERLVGNSTEARDGHRNEWGCHVDF